MSLKSYQELVDAVFFAKEDPKKLADILFPEVRDTAVNTRITIAGASTCKVSAATAAPTVRVFDQYNLGIESPTVTFAIKAAVTGCTVAADTGILTCDETAVVGSKPIVVATAGSITAELTITVEAAE